MSKSTKTETLTETLTENSETSPALKLDMDKLYTARLSCSDILNSLYSDDKGSADLFLKEYHEKYIYDIKTREWFLFINGEKGYELDTMRQRIADLQKLGHIYDLLKNDIEYIYEKKSAKYLINLINSRKKRLDSYRGCEEILKFTIVGEGSFARKEIEWDSVPYLVPFKNCLYDIRSGIARSYTQEDFFKARLNVNYEPEAKCPLFLQAVYDSLGEEKAEFILTYMGYALCRNPIEEKFLVLYGTGRNGKGILLESLLKTLGDLGGSINVEMLLKHKTTNASSASPELLATRGKALVVASEADSGKIFSARVKELTGNNFMSGRALYANDVVRFQQTAALIMETNQIPHIDGNDAALKKRLVIIRFPIQFVENPDRDSQRKIDPTLKGRISSEELPGIAGVLLEYAMKWYHGNEESGFNPKLSIPQSVIEETSLYLDSEDLLKSFTDEFLILNAPLGDRANVRQGESDNFHVGRIYEQYQRFCQQQNIPACSKIKFSKDLAERYRLKRVRDKDSSYFQMEDNPQQCVILRDPDFDFDAW